METIVSKMEIPVRHNAALVPYDIQAILLLFKDFSTVHTISSLSHELGMTRSGMWKILKRLEPRNYIVTASTGKKTSTLIPKLNFKNEELDKYLTLALSMEVHNYERWVFNFAAVKEHVSFFILYGSVLQSYEKAKDIDVIGIVPDRKGFKGLHEALDRIQKSESKRIHAINFTDSEFREELLKPNRALLEAVKKGVVLFKQERFMKFMKKVHGASP